jgi:cob(I)alamin adenosyltransferase
MARAKSVSTAGRRRVVRSARRRLRASDRGLTIVYYGDGKGKTTAALGTVLRAVGQGWRCAVAQFIKGSWPSSERKSIPAYLSRLVTITAGGKGFVGILDDRLPKAAHKRRAREMYREAGTLLKKKGLRLVVLDEILDAVEFGFLSEDEVVRLMEKKPRDLHLLLTGHKRFPAILRAADLVTRMQKEKHPYDKGFLAVRGVDY